MATSKKKTTARKTPTTSRSGGASKTPAKKAPAKKAPAKAERPRIQSSHGKGKAAAKKAPAKGRARPEPAAKRAPEGRTAKRSPGVTAKKGVRLSTGAARPALPKLRAPKGPPVRSLGPSSFASDASRETATAVAVAAMDKKAVGLEILDVAGKVDYADFLVIMTGRSDRQVQALAYGIEDALKKKGVRLLAVEGMQTAAWVLMDFGDVVVHVFQDEARALYDIEGLWMDALRLPVPATTA